MTVTHSATVQNVDCVVLGGGITGAGVARDAAMRGLSVVLLESHDFASGTSHLTSKVVHGGLRYLEHGHIKPVIDALIERHRLLEHLAPNLIHPLKFVLPFEGRRFVPWLYTVTGLQLYGLPEWYRCGRGSNPMLGVRLRRDYPLMKPYPMAVTFWDAQTEDSRLVMATLRTAAGHGAVLHNHTTIESAKFERGAWRMTVHNEREQRAFSLSAKTIVNATGPWSPLTAETLGVKPMPLTWLKGSHIVLPRPARFGDDAIIMRSVRDARRLWVIPWQHRLIVGSTECAYEGDLRDVRATCEEVDDLFESFARAFPGAGFTRSDICCAYAGVRPIVPQHVATANRLSREHRIDIDEDRRLVTLLGGKLTTFRIMAEQAIDEVDRLLGRDEPDADVRRELRHALLWPGLSLTEAHRLRANLTRVYELDAQGESIARHLVRLYGWDASLILDEIARDASLAQPIASPLPYTLAELEYLCRTEKPLHLIDLLKRRTSLYFLADHCCAAALPHLASRAAAILGWDDRQTTEEAEAVSAEFAADTQACAAPIAPAAGRPRRTVVA